MLFSYKNSCHIPETNTYAGIKYWLRYYFLKYSPPIFYEKILSCFFYYRFKRKLNLKNPQTLYEKLNYLKLYDLSKKKKMLSDRLIAKKWIKQNIPELKVAEVFQVSTSFKGLDFSNCPKSFIIKTNHACKSGIYIENKEKITNFQYKQLAKYYNKVLKINYAYWGIFELQYKDIVPKVYMEEFLSSDNNAIFKEYNVYCFNGKPIIINIDGPRGAGFFDENWNKVEYSIRVKLSTNEYPTDLNKQKILDYSKIISQDFIFVRVDFFEINNILYFAEATFTPLMGDVILFPEEYNQILGNYLDINSAKSKRGMNNE